MGFFLKINLNMSGISLGTLYCRNMTIKTIIGLQKQAKIVFLWLQSQCKQHNNKA